MWYWSLWKNTTRATVLALVRQPHTFFLYFFFSKQRSGCDYRTTDYTSSLVTFQCRHLWNIWEGKKNRMRDTYWKPNLLCTFPNLHMLFLTADYTRLHHANRGKIKRQLVTVLLQQWKMVTHAHTHTWHRGMQAVCTWNLMRCIKIKKVGQQKIAPPVVCGMICISGVRLH